MSSLAPDGRVNFLRARLDLNGAIRQRLRKIGALNEEIFRFADLQLFLVNSGENDVDLRFRV